MKCLTNVSTLIYITILTFLAATVSLSFNADVHAQTYLPDETSEHEGTWLQWPHHYTYGKAYRNRLDTTWVTMTAVLVQSENVHIVAYNRQERRRITRKLNQAGVSMDNIDFLIRRNNDTWIRDNGPVFVVDDSQRPNISDLGFNGWGFDTPYRLDDRVPAGVARMLGLPRIDLNDIVLEGGAIEVDGNGVLMATRSSILEPNRNDGWTQEEMEKVQSKVFGIDKFIWLDGAPGGQEDITDTHIDGFARFGDPRTIVTMDRRDLNYWGISNADINTLNRASDVDGRRYEHLRLPLTQHDVVTEYGFDIGFKGSYVNYYVANTVVLIPQYNDPNDAIARDILQSLYTDRLVVGVDVRNLYRNGGMIHCVTQQQPAAAR